MKEERTLRWKLEFLKMLQMMRGKVKIGMEYEEDTKKAGKR
jgi:hypothetical protein